MYPRILSCTILESMLLPRALSYLGALQWKDRRGSFSYCWKQGLPYALLYHPGALRLHGACRMNQEDPSSQALSLKCLDSVSCQSRGVWTAHHLPLGCMPTEHAWLRMKACTVCTHLAWPLTSAPGQSEAAEGGRTLLLLLVLLLCNSSPLWPAPYWAYREAPLA